MTGAEHGLLVEAARAMAVAAITAAGMQNGVYLWQLVVASVAMRQRPPVPSEADLWRRYAGSAPPIALLAPAFNEQATVVESVRSLLALHYPNFEIVVINDGSTDGTLQTLIEAFELTPVERNYDLPAPCQPIRAVYASRNQPRLVVVDKVNGGKADALNAGVNLARAPIVCAMDADSLLEPDALLRAVRPFVEDPERTVAVGGTVRVANGCRIAHGQVLSAGLSRNPLALLQTMEYLRAYVMARLAWSQAGLLLIISGAFGLFRRQAVLDVGGYSHGTVGEDMELVVKLHKHFRQRQEPYRIVFEPDPVCWTEAPETLGVLGRQRARWQRGALEALSRHRDMLFNPRYGRIGWVAFGNVLLMDAISPAVVAIGYLLIPACCFAGLLSIDYLKAFAAVAFVFGVFISVGALALEEAKLRRLPDARALLLLMLTAVAENFGYRQVNDLWRLRGAWQFLTRAKGWGAMTRRGFKHA
jgi:cellulose synthase/poly-beta-1,6-N-acetylglucosamine synthase-like glycosyltransferase